MKNDLKHHVYNRLIHVLFRKIIFDDDRVEFFPRIILLSLNKAILSYILRDPFSCILSFHNLMFAYDKFYIFKRISNILKFIRIFRY